jgi:hypothetical protein
MEGDLIWCIFPTFSKERLSKTTKKNSRRYHVRFSISGSIPSSLVNLTGRNYGIFHVIFQYEISVTSLCFQTHVFFVPKPVHICVYIYAIYIYREREREGGGVEEESIYTHK